MIVRQLLSALLLLCYVASPVAAAELSLFAASSLTDALTEVVRQYQQQYPADRVMLNFAGSQALATQIEQGAPADLFISANRSVMDRLQKGGSIDQQADILGNRLVMALCPDLRPQPADLHELAQAKALLLIGNAQVPVGQYTRQLFAALSEDPHYGIDLVAALKERVASEESKVKAIVAKLLLGEADAGIVYRSDLIGNNLNALPLPVALNPQALYPLAKVAGGSPQAENLYRYLLSPAAARIFKRYGFLTGSEL